MMPTDTAEQKITEQQKSLVKRWSGTIERAVKKQDEDKTREKFKKHRKYVRGNVNSDGEKGLTRTNIIHSNFAAILPQIYAKNPEISAIPSEAVGQTDQVVHGFCKTIQAVLNRVFVKGGKLKPRAKSAIRSGMTTGAGWLKIIWQDDIDHDPVMNGQLSDIQDNLQRIRFLAKQIKADEKPFDEIEAKQAELEEQIKALSEKVELSSASGIVIDRVMTEDIFILDDTLYDFDTYTDARAIAHRIWMTKEKFEQVFGKEPPGRVNYYNSEKKLLENSENDSSLLAVFEVWDRQSSRVYTLCAGADEWARDPYTPPVLGRRFYPFFGLVFNQVDGSMTPLSDAELLIELQDEYSTTRTNFAEHRRENLPTRIYNKTAMLDDNDLSNLANRKANDWIGVNLDMNTPVHSAVAILQNPPVDPATYDVSPILRDAELVLGAGDASKGVVNRAKTATEAEIMAMGLQNRIADRIDVTEDWLTDMANYATELCLMAMSKDDVVKIAGIDSVWPELSKEGIFNSVQIDIRAGSTGRPSKARDREQWAQMLPQIQKAVEQILQLRQAGQNDMAEAVKKLLEETLRRFDDRTNIESFFPQSGEEGEGAQQREAPPSQQVQQQFQQMQAALQQLQQENEALKQQADGNAQKMELEYAKLGLDKEKLQAEIQLKLKEIDAQANTSIAEAKIKAFVQAEIERLKIESQQTETVIVT